MRRLLLIGANGQIGFELRRSLAPLGQVIVPPRDTYDLANADDLKTWVCAFRPEAIFLAAAFTDVEGAEAYPERASAVNAAAPAAVAAAAAETGALLVHYSSDYVFDGRKSGPYIEDDAVCPLSVYGRTKAAGEAAVLASGAACLVFRTSWVFSSRSRNFALTILDAAREGRALRVIDDQFGAPTSAAMVADVTAHVVHAYFRGGRANTPLGIYHVAAAGETSWHGYAMELVRAAAARGMPVRIGPCDIAAVSTAAYGSVAQRPANSRLDTTRLTGTFALHMPDWQYGVAHLLDQITMVSK